jgi:regulator of protease activity HflC (stomatin/prohibitin superfamily)
MSYLLAFLVVLIVWLAVRSQLASVTIFEYERGLRFVRGTLQNELNAGRYWYFKGRTTIRTFDLRPSQIAINGQEILSRDGVAVKVSLSAGYRVANPRTAVMAAADYAGTLYVELQQALRSAVSTADIDALLANRAEIGPQILAQSQAVAERLGVVLEQVAVRDLTFPGELKKLFTQVVKARQEGLAALERARGETAALRNLANAAAMVERSPQLLQLRLLQVAGQQPGTTLVLGVPGNVPFPVRGGEHGARPGAPDAANTDSDS